ncbi:hypothetical protein CE91St44_01030 [Oscillospiraceae bacterium]|nr:hypothetical protein CE91St44_01030 [Oscillospiraceae bacterium]
MKKTFVFIAAALALLLAACVRGENDCLLPQAATPEEAVAAMTSALETADGTALDALVQYAGGRKNGVFVETERFWGGRPEGTEKAYLVAVFQELACEVLSVEYSAEEKALLTLAVTNKDLAALDLADHVQAEDLLEAETSAVKAITGTITQTVEAQAVKTQAGWQVVVDEALRSALWGGHKSIARWLWRE